MEIKCGYPAIQRRNLYSWNTTNPLYACTKKYNIDHEICVTNDNSKDHYRGIEILTNRNPNLGIFYQQRTEWFGYAVRYGLGRRFSDDCVAVMMADMSDDPKTW